MIAVTVSLWLFIIIALASLLYLGLCAVAWLVFRRNLKKRERLE